MHIFASHQRADYVCASYVGAGGVHVARVMFAVGEAVWYVRRAVQCGRQVVRYEVFTAGEELFHVGDELLTVATAFD